MLQSILVLTETICYKNDLNGFHFAVKFKSKYSKLFFKN